MMTALTRRRCTKAWQVGQLPRTHYFSPGTKLVMCKVTPVTDWPIVNRENSQVLHEGGERKAQGYTGRENMMYWGEMTQRFGSLAKSLELQEQSLSWPCKAAGCLQLPFRDPAHPLGQPQAKSIFSLLRPFSGCHDQSASLWVKRREVQVREASTAFWKQKAKKLTKPPNNSSYQVDSKKKKKKSKNGSEVFFSLSNMLWSYIKRCCAEQQLQIYISKSDSSALHVLYSLPSNLQTLMSASETLFLGSLTSPGCMRWTERPHNRCVLQTE